MNRICIRFCYLCAHIRALLINNVTENLGSILLALIVTNDTNLQALLVAKILVVMHLTRYKGISTLTKCIVQQKIASTTTDGYLADRTAQQFVTLSTLNIKLALQQQNEIISSHLGRQLTNHATTRFYAIYRLLCKETTILQSQALGYFPVDTTQRIVHISMHRDDDNIVFQSLDDTALHIVSTANLLESAEQERMVADNEIAAFANGFVNNLFVDV